MLIVSKYAINCHHFILLHKYNKYKFIFRMLFFLSENHTQMFSYYAAEVVNRDTFYTQHLSPQLKKKNLGPFHKVTRELIDLTE